MTERLHHFLDFEKGLYPQGQACIFFILIFISHIWPVKGKLWAQKVLPHFVGAEEVLFGLQK